MKGNHDFHPPNQAEISLKLDIKEDLKRKLEGDPFGEIPTMAKNLLAQAPKRLKLSQETKANLPTQRSIEASLYRERELNIPELPATLADLVIEGRYRCTSDNLDFLLIEDGIEDKILVFGTILELQRLCSCEVVFMDGTFHSAPNLFAQNYILHGICLGIILKWQ